MIEVEHLRKSYGTFEAVRDVSFTVRAGEVVGFLGPNGAGKSTTLRILAGFLGATSGRVSVAGFDLATRALEAREHVGYMPEAVPLYPEMRVREYLAFRAECKRVPRRDRATEIDRVLEAARARDMASVVIGHLSKGYRQRVGLADALLGSPPLLVLDEPTAGLDPNQIRDVRALVRDLGEGHTVLLSTHILSEVEATCSRAIVIARGELVAEGSLAQLRDRARASSLAVRVAPASLAKARAALEGLAGVARVRVADARLVLDVANRAELDHVAERASLALAAAGVGARELAPVAASLEQVFAELTKERPA